MNLITKTTLGVMMLGLSLWAVNKANANRITDTEIVSQLPSLLAQAKRPFSGVIVVKKNNQPLFTYISGKDIDIHSSFVIASLSKQITATLILKSVDEGKLQLDKAAVDYLADLEGIDPRITIDQLLSNTSGITKRGEPVLFEPGSEFSYSNLGYNILGLVLEQVNRLPLQQQIARLNTEAALGGMFAKTGKTSEIKRNHPGLALGRYEQADKILPIDLSIDSNMLPYGGIIATAPAYSHFQQALYSGNLISQQNLEHMTRPHAVRPHRWGALDYGYGLQLSTDNKLREFSHSGYIPGYVSLCLYYPESAVSVVILENTSWDLSDTSRAFGLHDDIRASVRHKLIQFQG